MAAEASASTLRPREMITPGQQFKTLCAISPVYEEVANIFPIGVRDLVFQYAGHEYDLFCARWYIALREIGMLPVQIPTLPRHIHYILKGKSPTHGDDPGPDKPFLRVFQTHFFYLIPPGTLNELETCVSDYGQKHLAQYGGQNPFQFRYFWEPAREEHGNVRFDEPEWVLMLKDVLPGSRNQSCKEHVKMVEKLSEKAFVKYELPSLRAVAWVAFLHKIATAESILPEGNEQDGRPPTYTRVQGGGLVGHFSPDGLEVDSPHFGRRNVGVLAMRKLT